MSEDAFSKRYASVSRWFADLPNPRTRRIYRYGLEKFVTYTGMDPDQLCDLGKQDSERAHTLLKRFFNSLRLASKTKMMIYQTIRSFYRVNNVILGRKPRTYRAAVEYEPRTLYTQDDVAWLVDAADNSRDKALIMFFAQSGQRVSVVVSLKLKHVDIAQPSPLVIDIPGMLRNPRGFNVNKSQTPYRFLIGEDTKFYLTLMVRERRDRGEPLDDESWLFRSSSVRLADKEIRKVKLSTPGLPLSSAQVGQIVRDAASKRGIQRKYGKRYLFHPHGFRRYWKHQLRMGGVDPVLLEYMMGHVLPYGGAYDRWTLEDMMHHYKRAENYVRLRPTVTLSKETLQAEVLKVLLGNIGQAVGQCDFTERVFPQ